MYIVHMLRSPVYAYLHNRNRALDRNNSNRSVEEPNSGQEAAAEEGAQEDLRREHMGRPTRDAGLDLPYWHSLAAVGAREREGVPDYHRVPVDSADSFQTTRNIILSTVCNVLYIQKNLFVLVRLL